MAHNNAKRRVNDILIEDDARAKVLIDNNYADLIAEVVVEKAVKDEPKEQPVKEEKKAKAIKVEPKKEKAVKRNAKK